MVPSWEPWWTVVMDDWPSSCKCVPFCTDHPPVGAGTTVCYLVKDTGWAPQALFPMCSPSPQTRAKRPMDPFPIKQQPATTERSKWNFVQWDMRKGRKSVHKQQQKVKKIAKKKIASTLLNDRDQPFHKWRSLTRVSCSLDLCCSLLSCIIFLKSSYLPRSYVRSDFPWPFPDLISYKLPVPPLTLWIFSSVGSPLILKKVFQYHQNNRFYTVQEQHPFFLSFSPMLPSMSLYEEELSVSVFFCPYFFLTVWCFSCHFLISYSSPPYYFIFIDTSSLFKSE